MTISRTVGEKNFAATTVTIDMFINHFDKDQAILFSFPAPVKVYHHARCSTADKQNNHTTVNNTEESLRSRKTDALYATGQVIINVIMMIDIRSIWAETCFLTLGKYFCVAHHAAIGRIQYNNKSVNIAMLSIATLCDKICSASTGNKKGNVSVLMIARHNANKLLPCIKRVKATAAIHAGAILSKKTHIATSFQTIHHSKK